MVGGNVLCIIVNKLDTVVRLLLRGSEDVCSFVFLYSEHCANRLEMHQVMKIMSSQVNTLSESVSCYDDAA